MAQTIKELEKSIKAKNDAATEKGGGESLVRVNFMKSLTPDEREHYEKMEEQRIAMEEKRITAENKDNYYNNIAYIADVMVYVKIVAIVTIVIWILSIISFFYLMSILS